MLGIVELVGDVGRRFASEWDGLPRTGVHRQFMRDLGRSLRAHGFLVHLEWPIVTHRPGYIDMYAVAEGIDMVLEFDTGKRFKWKSLEKLAACDASVRVAVVAQSHPENHDRLAKYPGLYGLELGITYCP